MAVEFLNVDLEIELRHEEPKLLAAFGRKIHVLYNGPRARKKWLLALEVETGSNPKKKIEAFCSLIENFSPIARKLWEAALVRRFDIGYKTNGIEKISKELFNSVLLERVAGLSAEIALTIYPAELDRK